MELKTKKSLSLVSFLILALGGLLFPFHQVQAVVPLVGAGIAATVVYVAGWIMQAVAQFSATLVTLAGLVLGWVLNIDWSYTSGGIVEIGWPIVRDLANISFVVMLVAIGLATALRIEGYQAKTTLRNLVVIILLVNFTPAIAGLIVDASNIVMNFFIQGLDPGAYWGAIISARNSIMPADIWERLNPFKEINMLLGSLAIISINLVVWFILTVFSVLFLVRYVAIWILVILSPICFAAYILPATRSYWKMWWNQFLQWCIIGTIASFFLYLGTMLLSKLDTLIPLPSTQGGEALDPFNILVSLMPLITVALFFGVGLFASLSISATGAKEIVSSMKKGGIAARNVMAKKAWGGGTSTIGTIKRMASAVGTQEKMARISYRAGRVLGLSRTKAFGTAMKRSWERRIEPALQQKQKTVLKTTKKEISAAGKGTLKAIKDIGIASYRAAFGIKAKKKKTGKDAKAEKMVPCPTCKGLIAESAERCNHCGAKFE